MESNNINKLLKSSEEIKYNTLKEMNLTLNDLKDAVRITTEWFGAQPHLPKIIPDPKQIECIYMSCKGSIERTKTCLDTYYSLKNIYPEVFTNKDPCLPEMKQAADGLIFSFQPILSGKVRLVCIKCQDGELNAQLYYKCFFMACDIRMHYDYAEGCSYIFDMTGVTLNGHITKFTPAIIKMIIFAAQEAYVARIKSVHMINVPKIGEALVQLFRSTLKPKLRSRVFIHKDYESLHQHIDKNLLPKDFGGDLEPIENVYNDWFNQMIEMRDWFLEREEHRSDETKREGKQLVNEMLGVHGSFRKLDVD